MSVKFQSALFLAAATLLVQTGQYGTSTSEHRAATSRNTTTGVPACAGCGRQSFRLHGDAMRLGRSTSIILNGSPESRNASP